MPSRARQPALEGPRRGQRGVADLSRARGLHHAQLVSLESRAREGRAHLELCGGARLWPARDDQRQDLAAQPRGRAHGPAGKERGHAVGAVGCTRDLHRSHVARHRGLPHRHHSVGGQVEDEPKPRDAGPRGSRERPPPTSRGRRSRGRRARHASGPIERLTKPERRGGFRARTRPPENARAPGLATCGSHDPRVNASLAPADKIRGKGERMTRIATLDRADMNAEQARVYDAAKASSGIVGGPYHAYIRLPKLFEACQDLRASLSSGPLSRREQQIVNLVVARHWSARYPWFAQVRASLAVGIERPVIDAINARKTPDLADARERTCFVVAHELLASKGLSDQTYAAAETTMGLEGLVALVASTGSFSMTCMTANTFGIDPPAENPTPLAE